ncbi:GPI-anchor transamidase [Starmerella bacillaris]|uniref:GPI mannosyltransferase 2 n=1 Tax=Starmerella bacillaris TaxID=1247836 RepID=A0AAV5RF95_STABA|nr:GPI-anchor transamidase [Starmerella bacillaris]
MNELARVIVASVTHKVLLLTFFLTPTTTLWDTSSTLLIDSNPSIVESLKARLLTWDSVYYTSTALRGVEFEHEYAFSKYWSLFIRACSPRASIIDLAVTAAVISLIAHTTALATLYIIAKRWNIANPNLCVLTYALSPAGIFLVNGYPESLFALLSFLGVYCFYTDTATGFVVSGLCFGLATIFRSNGLLWGILFAVHVIFESINLLRGLRIAKRLKKLAALFVGGSITGSGFVYTQWNAYTQLCPGHDFCDNRIPSVYLFIQTKYWSNGFLQYWTPNNIPNFILAIPSLILLCFSANFLIRRRKYALACVHIVMFIGALFFWNVQIITRISSCLPGMYLYLAYIYPKTSGKVWIAYSAIWSVIQAALYGAFMPPA